MLNRGLKFVEINEHSDARGKIRIVEVDGGGLPFVPVRSFIVSDVPTGKTRAGTSARRRGDTSGCAGFGGFKGNAGGAWLRPA